MAVTGQIDKYKGKSIGETYSPCLQGLPWRCKNKIFSFIIGYDICSLSPVMRKHGSMKLSIKDLYYKYLPKNIESQVSDIWKGIFLDIWKGLLGLEVIDSSRHCLLQLPNSCHNKIFSFLADERHDYAAHFILRINQSFNLSVTKSWLEKNQDIKHQAGSIVLQAGKMLFEAAVVISTTWAEGFPYLAKYLLNLVCCKNDGQPDVFTIQRHGILASNLWGCAATSLSNVASRGMVAPRSF